ncbi:glycosyltransferase family 2 protein [Sphaerospermopsis aphanizomenoides BCCUSP55]|uniref:glycosyltransferase family 2 protein n=1 Tax=Sphaerospermopsis aphanizomenoides TaxID=459663 RepID=UPI00190714CC|nr:glycosyltransferase family 2 protein [Sphaerospermopsis aphanizomenoides]MBK1990748.1 glycosyltransferase family 2 protein [Sphaerospermopsis aphanizomenoides BCCUSP55]
MKIAKVAAIIVTWNKIKDVCSVIEDTNKLNLHGICLDIFVVDNASSDGTQAYIQEHYPQIKVLQTGENIGGSGGFSHGMKFLSELDYDYIWLLDNDVRLDNQALLPLVETLQNYSQVGLVGSQIRKLEHPEIIQEIGSYIDPKKAHLKTYLGNYPIISTEELLAVQPFIVVDICAAASLLFRHELIQQIGVFENYFLHFDDVEWCLRAKQAGWVVAAHPASIVWHCSPDFKHRPWISYYDERNLCYCWQKYHPQFLLKRLRLLFPKLIYYSLTGRSFLAEIYLWGLEDFLKGVKGKIADELPYLEYSLPEIITNDGKVLVQSYLYQDICQFTDLEISEKFTFWYPPKNLGHRIYIWLISCFFKPVDLAICSSYKPEIFYFNLAKKVYFFSGAGYIQVNLNLMNVLINSLQVFYRLLKIYLQMSIFANKTAGAK